MSYDPDDADYDYTTRKRLRQQREDEAFAAALAEEQTAIALERATITLEPLRKVRCQGCCGLKDTCVDCGGTGWIIVPEDNRCPTTS